MLVGAGLEAGAVVEAAGAASFAAGTSFTPFSVAGALAASGIFVRASTSGCCSDMAAMFLVAVGL